MTKVTKVELIQAIQMCFAAYNQSQSESYIELGDFEIRVKLVRGKVGTRDYTKSTIKNNGKVISFRKAKALCN